MSDNSLAHFGVKGMKWGQHKKSTAGVSPKTDREARKDADEFTKAKLFYGEGAGTRRKLIKAKVEAKSAKDPSYKKAFESHVANTDLGKRAEQARGERKRKDVVKGTAKTARGVKNLTLGNGAAVSMGALAVYTAANNPQVQQAVKKNGAVLIKGLKNMQNDKAAKAFMKSMGF